MVVITEIEAGSEGEGGMRTEKPRSSQWRLAGSAVVLAILALFMGGCPNPFGTPVSDLKGRVDFGSAYRAQATPAEIAKFATVSVIDVALNQTVATTVTDTNGSFVLSFGRWRPTLSKVYYLEAVKGLASNEPGYDAARLRTMIRSEAGGWTSITSSLIGSPITVSRSTTAISAAANLKKGSPLAISEGDLIGSLQVGVADSTDTSIPDTFNGATNFATIQFRSVWKFVDQALKLDLDPLAFLFWDSGTDTFTLNTPTDGPYITGLSPNTGTEGTRVTLNGIRFETAVASNSVTFDSVPATVVSANSTQLVVDVPAGAKTGWVIVNTEAGGPSNQAAFMVLAKVGGTFRGN